MLSMMIKTNKSFESGLESRVNDRKLYHDLLVFMNRYHWISFIRRSWHRGRKPKNLHMIGTVNTRMSLKRLVDV